MPAAVSENLSFTAGDLTGDDWVDLTDFSALADFWLQEQDASCSDGWCGDLNGDCKVNLLDFADMAQFWNPVHP